MRNSILILAALAVVGCSRSETPPVAQTLPPPDATTTGAEPAVTPPEAAAAAEAQHHATLAPGKGASIAGTLGVAASNGGAMITGQITGLTPNSDHGFHVHEKGDCSSPDFKSAGEHFNPTSQPHGNPASPPHHLGDALNIAANAEGTADVNARIAGVTVGDGGANDIVGKAIVVHAQPDDYKTQPSGNSGDRIACGVIE